MTTEQTKFETGDTVRFKGGSDEWKFLESISVDCRIKNNEITTWTLIRNLELVSKAPKMVKKSGWVNVYANQTVGTFIYEDKETAKSKAFPSRVATVFIEWEEPA